VDWLIHIPCCCHASAHKATVTIANDMADRTGIYYFSLAVAFTGNALNIFTADEGCAHWRSSGMAATSSILAGWACFASPAALQRARDSGQCC
jgi:hypothetical protein